MKSYILNKNATELLEDVKRYKKLDYNEFANEKFERKSYFSNLDLERIRLRYRLLRPEKYVQMKPIITITEIVFREPIFQISYL